MARRKIGYLLSNKQIKVEAYSGHKGEERPQAFEYRGKHYQIELIEATWFEESIETRIKKMHFKVRANGKECQISYQTRRDIWLFERFL